MSRRRGNSVRKYNFYACDGTVVLRRLQASRAEEYVKAGIAMRVLDALGRVIAYKRSRHPLYSHDGLIASRHSGPSITRSEMDAIAGRAFKGGENLDGVYGASGRSRTKGLSEEDRLVRFESDRDCEDLVERAEVKLAAFAPRFAA